MDCFHGEDWQSLRKTGQELSLPGRCCDRCQSGPQTAEDTSASESTGSSEDSEGSSGLGYDDSDELDDEGDYVGSAKWDTLLAAMRCQYSI